MKSYFTGEFYDSFIIPRGVSFQTFILKGWVKLDNLKEIKKESQIFRVILDSNYEDDENLGDRLLYLKYF